MHLFGRYICMSQDIYRYILIDNIYIYIYIYIYTKSSTRSAYHTKSTLR